MKPLRHFRAWLVVALLWLTVFFNYFVRILPTTMHGSLVAAIPMTEAQFGLLTASLFWAFGLMSPFGGFLADRFDRSRVVITSALLWSVLTWLMSFARTYDQLLVMRTLLGVSEACYTPASLALISDYHRTTTRSLATGIHGTGSSFGGALSGLGGWIAERTSWQYAFSLVGLVSLAYSVALAFVLRDPPREIPSGAAAAPTKPRVHVGEALVSLFGRGNFVLTFFAATLIGLTYWTAASWMPVFLREHFHMTQGAAGLSATGYMNAAGVPGIIIGGILSDRWSRTESRARMYVPAIGFFIASLGILLTANTNVLMLAVLGLVIFQLFMAFFQPNLMPILYEVVDPRYRATGYGFINMMAMVAAGTGIYFSGVGRDLKIDLHLIFDVLAVAFLVCSLMFYLIKPNRPSVIP